MALANRAALAVRAGGDHDGLNAKGIVEALRGKAKAHNDAQDAAATTVEAAATAGHKGAVGPSSYVRRLSEEEKAAAVEEEEAGNGNGGGGGLVCREELAEVLMSALGRITTTAVSVSDIGRSGAAADDGGDGDATTSCRLLDAFGKACFASCCIQIGLLLQCHQTGAALTSSTSTSTPSSTATTANTSLDKPLVLPSSHPLSLQLASTVLPVTDNLRRKGLLRIKTCDWYSGREGLVEVILRLPLLSPVERDKGYGCKTWRVIIGGEGIGDDPAIAATIGTSPRAPIAVRFDEPISMCCVDDTGMVDETFWVNTPSIITLDWIVKRLMEWLSGPPKVGGGDGEVMAMEVEGNDENQSSKQWYDARAHFVQRHQIITKYREAHAKSEELVHPTIEGSWIRPEWLAPAFKACGKEGCSLAEWEACLETALATPGVIEEVHRGCVYAFDLFTPAFCDLLVAECDTFERSDLPKRRPNTMNNFGLVINDIGMHPLMTNLLRGLIDRFLSSYTRQRRSPHHWTIITPLLSRMTPSQQGVISL